MISLAGVSCAAPRLPSLLSVSVSCIGARFIFLSDRVHLQVVSGRSGLSIPSLPCADPGAVVQVFLVAAALQTTRESVDKPLHPALTSVPAHGFMSKSNALTSKLCLVLL